MQIGIDVCCWSNRRGYGRYTRELVTHIVAGCGEHEFTLFVDAQTAGDCQLPAGARVEVMTTSRQPTRAASAGGFRSPLDLWRMRRAVARYHCDVFFFPASYSFFPIPRRIPTVITLHDAIPETHPRLTFARWRSRLFWAIKTRMALRQADRLLTVSHQAKAVITSTFGYPASAIEVVPEAPGGQFRVLNDAEALGGVREHYRLPQDAPLLLYVGGISPHKNLHGLMRALAHLRGCSPSSWHLVLVGDHQTDSFLGCHGELQRLCCSLDLNGRVTFTGFVPDDHLVALYNTATLLVLPSFDEGFGLPAVEAMACGLPVVASSRGSLPEVIGSAGEFMDPDNHDQMAAVIAGLLDDPRRRGELRARGLERAACFSWPAAARQTIRVLEETARAAAGNA